MSTEHPKNNLKILRHRNPKPEKKDINVKTPCREILELSYKPETEQSLSQDVSVTTSPLHDTKLEFTDRKMRFVFLNFH